MAKNAAAARLRARRSRRPVFVRRERREGWSADLPIYVIWCEECRDFTETHPAGYGRLRCRTCRHTLRVMTWQRFRDKELVPFLKIAPFFIALALVLSYLILRLR